MASTRIEEEKRVVEIMIRLYCKHHHKGRVLCTDCMQLLAYAHKRLERCRYGEQKGTCRLCPVHCYHPDKAKQMRMVMRWSGPRMMLHYPVISIKHMLYEFLHK